jgi:hypothetical protein
MEDLIDVQQMADETERQLQAFVKSYNDLIAFLNDRNLATASGHDGSAPGGTVGGPTRGLSDAPQAEHGVTRTELVALVEQYRAELEAELMLLYRLHMLSIEQRRATQTGSTAEFQCITVQRDRIMTTLATVEHELRAVRSHLAAGRERLADVPAFQDVIARHTEVSDLVADILDIDRDSLDALHDANEARRLAVPTES